MKKIQVDISRKLYNTSETANIIGVTKEAIVYWLKKGKLKGTKIGGRWFVYKDEIDRIVNINKN